MMGGGIYTKGPLYRPDPGARIRDYRPPAMPPRYQPRPMSLDQVGLKAIPERATEATAAQVQAQPCNRMVAAEAPAAAAAEVKPAPRTRGKRADRGAIGGAMLPSLTQRILGRLKASQGWVNVSELIAIAPERLDVKSVANLLHRYRSLEQVVTRRSEDGTTLDYCWGAIARTGERAKQARNRSLSPSSLTFWVCSALRTDRERWMSTEEIAEIIATLTTTIERPAPAVVSTRLSPLIRSGRLERRRREGAKHGHGSTMEYRLTTAF